ncbi:hypothetical protein, partial [Streptomyces sp. NPDC091278]|uniref:hypothetical protein n=1 Tax=Streptomyces sp. NPDC091278 TaxID=3155301 RepID=UPI00344C4514
MQQHEIKLPCAVFWQLAGGATVPPHRQVDQRARLRGHLIIIHADASEMSFSIRQVGVDSPVSSRAILLAIAQ